MANNTAIVPVSDYALVGFDTTELKSVIQENLGGGNINAFDLDRVKVPSGGGTTWEIPTLTGPEPAKAINGVIVFWEDQRQYWAAGIEDGGNKSPDCSGKFVHIGDGEKAWIGKGDRDKNGDWGPHECDTCPYNQFGSARKGGGKACKETRLIGIISEENILPMMLSIPVSSTKALRAYFLRLAGKGVPYWSVVTSLTLQKAKNAEGIEYAEVVPNLVSVLTPEQKPVFRSYVEQIKPLLERAQTAQRSDQNVGSSFTEDEDMEPLED